jgi:hypothetical protein
MNMAQEKAPQKESNENNSPKSVEESPTSNPDEEIPDLPPTAPELLPKQQVELIQMTKTGAITLPKDIRDKLPQKATFAFWKDMSRLIFQPISQQDIPNLNLAVEEKKEKQPKKRAEKKAGEEGEVGKKGERKKAIQGPQFEPAKYFLYEFDNQDKVSVAIESAFYKFAEQPPNLEEGVNRIKYVLITYIGGNSTTDSRLRNTMINFMCDVVEKFQIQELLAFMDEKIVFFIKSKFLLEQSLIKILCAALKVKNYEIMKKFLQEIFKSAESYPDTDLFAIMQALKKVVYEIIKVGVDIPQEIKGYIRDEFKKFISGFQSPGSNATDPPMIHSPFAPDKVMELVELLEKLRLIEDAYNIAEELLMELKPDSKDIDRVRQKVNSLSQKPI